MLEHALKSLCQLGWRLDLLAPLEGGKTNASYLVAFEKRRLVLRINHPNSLALGIDRALEKSIMQALPQGIAPSILFYNEQYLLCEYIHSDQQAANASHEVDILKALRLLHGINISGQPMDYIARLDFLLPDDQHHQWENLLQSLQALIADFDRRFGKHEGLCHHDLVPQNILWTPSGPRFIDWEYAAKGDIFFDLACIVENHPFWQKKSVQLLESYGLSAELKPKLLLFRAIYWAISAAWCLRSGLPQEASMVYIEKLILQCRSC